MSVSSKFPVPEFIYCYPNDDNVSLASSNSLLEDCDDEYECSTLFSNAVEFNHSRSAEEQDLKKNNSFGVRGKECKIQQKLWHSYEGCRDRLSLCNPYRGHHRQHNHGLKSCDRQLIHNNSHEPRRYHPRPQAQYNNSGGGYFDRRVLKNVSNHPREERWRYNRAKSDFRYNRYHHYPYHNTFPHNHHLQSGHSENRHHLQSRAYNFQQSRQHFDSPPLQKRRQPPNEKWNGRGYPPQDYCSGRAY